MKLEIVKTNEDVTEPTYDIRCGGCGTLATARLDTTRLNWVVFLPDDTLLGTVPVLAETAGLEVTAMIRAHYEWPDRIADEAAYYAALTEG